MFTSKVESLRERFNLHLHLIKNNFSSESSRDVNFVKPDRTFRNLVVSTSVLLFFIAVLIILSIFAQKRDPSFSDKGLSINSSYPTFLNSAGSQMIERLPISKLNTDETCAEAGLNNVNTLLLILGIPKSGLDQISSLLTRNTNILVAREMGLLGQLLMTDLTQSSKVNDLFCEVWSEEGRSKSAQGEGAFQILADESGWQGVQLVANSDDRFQKMIIAP